MSSNVNPFFIFRRINRLSVCVTNTTVNELDGKLVSSVQMYELVIGLTQNVISHIKRRERTQNRDAATRWKTI